MRKFSLYLVIIFIGITKAHAAPLQNQVSAQQFFSAVPAKLIPAVQSILRLPEARELLHEVCAQGKVRIELQYDRQGFEALWNQEQRTIVLNTAHCRDMGSRIRCLLFELHNARAASQFTHTDHLALSGRVSINSYVESIERIEHMNVLQTARLLNQGIARGIFPSDAFWDMMHDFTDHYKMQQLTGHSQQIAQTYYILCDDSRRSPFRGTISQLGRLSAKDKEVLTQYLWTKASLTQGDERERRDAAAFFEREAKRVNQGLGTARHRQLLNVVFDGKAPI